MFHFVRAARALVRNHLEAILFEDKRLGTNRFPRNLLVAMVHEKGPRIRLIVNPKLKQQLKIKQEKKHHQYPQNQQPKQYPLEQKTPQFTPKQEKQKPASPSPLKLKFEAKIPQKSDSIIQKTVMSKAEKKADTIEELKASVRENTGIGATIISTVTQTDSSKKTRSDDTGHSESESDSWQTMRFTFTLFGVSFTGVALFLLMELGKPKISEEGDMIEDEFSGLPLIQQYIYRMIHQLQYYKKLINEPSREKLLPDELKYPYHQPPYTLVLELKDVLVHPDWTYNTGWRFKKRPGIDQFLETLNGIYEIVIYTAELGMTVFPILEALDPNNLITYKLVRDATNFVDGKHVKDLDKLNRPLQKVILIDWDAEAVGVNRDNVLMIPRWNGDDKDTALLDLANLLRVIAISEIQDVRDVLRFYKEYDDPLAAFRERQRELERTMYSKS